MPIRIPDGLPAQDVLKLERISMIPRSVAARQDIRPLRIILLNLMPDKITTETQIARILGATPLQIDLTLMRTGTYMGKNTSEDHQLGFYRTWEEIKDEKFDGLIMTGAPVEQMPFEDVSYWSEIETILEWAKTNTFSQFYICWGAQAALYHYNGVPKMETPKKQFGVYTHERLDFYHYLTRGFDDEVRIPVSRHTRIDEDALAAQGDLHPLLRSPDTGVGLVFDEKHRRVYMFNHLEYDRETLKSEYDRDISKGLEIDVPVNYYPDDDPEKVPVMNWRSHRNLLFLNWINYVYQGTPYDLADLPLPWGEVVNQP